MSHIDDEFAEKIFMFLPGYKRSGVGLDFKLNAYCPVCNDTSSTRFWYYSNKTRLVCYNCGLRSNVRKYIENHKPEMMNQYMYEVRKTFTGSSGLKRSEKADPLEVYVKRAKEVPKVPSIEFSTRLDKISNRNHPIIKYVTDRCIPEKSWDRLWFTRDWKRVANSINPGTYSDNALKYLEPRLVIPIYNESGEIESIQGRDLTGKHKSKYMTIKTHEDATKIYGTNLIVPSMKVWVLEGPIDSLFIENSIAITGGEVSVQSMPYAGNRVWVMDNEPRHEDTISRMERLISIGESIVIFDRCPWKSKDINDMVKNEGAKPGEIIEYFRNNNLTGLAAKLRMDRWKKI